MRCANCRHRSGISLIYTSIIAVALIAIASLAVDFGRVSLARSELQTAVDASASAATARLNEGWAAARTAATEIALANRTDGTPVQLDENQDIEFGRWNSRTRSFEVATGFTTANAVRVTARRTAKRGNPIELPLGRLIGMPTCDVTASAVSTRLRYSLVGIEGVKMTGTATIDSYDSSIGKYGGGNTGENVSVISNRDINLGKNCAVYGDAHPGPNGTVMGASSVTGTTTPLPRALTFPMPTLDPSYNNVLIQPWLDSDRNLDLSGKMFTIQPGVYYVHNIDLASNASMMLQGQVTFYVSGNVILRGGIDLGGLPPGDFRIRVIEPGGTVQINGNASLSADLYAPGSDVSIVGTGDFYGTMVGKTIDLVGVAGVHGDESIAPYGGGGFLTLVK